MRSSWKGSYQHFSLLKLKLLNSEIIIDTYSRASIFDYYLNSGVFNVYNGKIFTKFTFTPEHLLHRLGEFARTRAFFIPKIKKKKAKAKKKTQSKKKK